MIMSSFVARNSPSASSLQLCFLVSIHTYGLDINYTGHVRDLPQPSANRQPPSDSSSEPVAFVMTIRVLICKEGGRLRSVRLSKQSLMHSMYFSSLNKSMHC
jgi:hypothetical protein